MLYREPAFYQNFTNGLNKSVSWIFILSIQTLSKDTKDMSLTHILCYFQLSDYNHRS
jgi:hypothetical protein